MVPYLTWPLRSEERRGIIALGFGWRGGDWDLARLGLIAHTGRTHLDFLGLTAWRWSSFALKLTALATILLLVLLRRLVHRVQDAEIVFSVLEIAFRHNPVATAGRIAAKLEVFLEQLLSGAANPQIGSVAVEHMVAIERDTTAASAAAMMPKSSSATTTTTGSMATSTHTFHVHSSAVTPSHLCWPGEREMHTVGPAGVSGLAPRPGFNPSALVPAGAPSNERFALGRPLCG